jgi:hypothetical protein
LEDWGVLPTPKTSKRFGLSWKTKKKDLESLLLSYDVLFLGIRPLFLEFFSGVVWTFRESGRGKNFRALPMAQGAKKA